jgi:hypothetical protein
LLAGTAGGFLQPATASTRVIPASTLPFIGV